MTDFLDRWAAESPEHTLLVAEERLITQATEAIWEEMEKAGYPATDPSTFVERASDNLLP